MIFNLGHNLVLAGKNKRFAVNLKKLETIAYLFTLAAVAGLVCHKIGLPPLIGFLIAGFSYNSLGLNPPKEVYLLSDLGIALLLFFVGLKLDLKSLLKIEILSLSLFNIIANSLFVALGLLLIGSLFLKDQNLPIESIALLSIALSLSSTVFAVKVLDNKGDLISVHGKLIIGILIIQDVIAAVLLAITEAKFPEQTAFLILLLVPAKFVIYKILDHIGHDELLVLFGLLLALVLGYAFFNFTGVKGELGALVVGALVANHPKSGEMSQALFSLKEFLLIGFFLTIGINSDLSIQNILAGSLLCLFLIPRGLLYFFSSNYIKFRSRTSLFTSITLTTYSEFSLIVVSIGYTQGLLSVDWLTITAVAVSLSFLITTPLEKNSENIYERIHKYLRTIEHKETKENQIKDLHMKHVKALVIGMGRIGSGAYEELQNSFKQNEILSIEHDEKKVLSHKSDNKNVILADANDLDFWSNLNEKTVEVIILAMPKHHSNIEAAKQIKNLNLDCQIYAVARFDEEVEELQSLGVTAFHIYTEAGVGLARQTYKT